MCGWEEACIIKENTLLGEGVRNYGKGTHITMVIGIIGAGASGMAAAIHAAQKEETEVLLLERQARVGRKLQATGNGRCNLSNLHALEGGYHGEEPDFSAFALNAFPPEKTRGWFRSLGLLTVAEPSGRVYPFSDQANSVVDVLRFALDRPNIRLAAGAEVTRVKRFGERFRLETAEETFVCDKLIVACGGLAGTKLGGGMSGYQILRSLGHHSTKLRPTLVQLKTDWPAVSALKGVRAECRGEILRNGQLWAKSAGEIQFTEYGLSGPMIFEMSRDVCREKGNWECVLDLLPVLSQEELQGVLKARRATNLPNGEILTGILHNRLGRVLVQSCGLPLLGRAAELTDGEIQELAEKVKGFSVHLTEPMGMDSAQVTAGGIVTGEFDPTTMESKLVPGLYACGEVLDVDGDCGGYNLQWAWSSGALAGNSAGGIK